jgi:hypothetical protein
MIKAVELLQNHEKHAIRKIGGSFVVQVGGQFFMVYPHVLVPQYAKVVRSTTGSLLGFPCCAGG